MFTPLKNLFNKMFFKITNYFDTNYCYYLHSNNILPPPLDEQKERALLELVALANIDARNELIVHNMRLVVFIAKKFESTRINLDDLISIGTIGLIKGVQTFKLEKNIKLATYASRCIENEILMYLRKTKNIRNDYSLDEVLSIDNEGNEMILADVLASPEPSSLFKLTKKEDEENLYYALSKLPKREKKIMTMRYGLLGEAELTQKEVADALGISQSYISRLEKRIIDKMRFLIEEKIKQA